MPRDVFGNKLEALDTIRINDEVWITLLPHRDPPWQVEIQGMDRACVDRAEAHYRNMIQKVLTATERVSSTTNIILDESEGSKVQLSRLSTNEGWWPNKMHMIIPRLLVLPMDVGNFRQETMDPEKLTEIEEGIRHALEGVRFDKGSYDLAIRFGCLCLDKLEEKEVQEIMDSPQNNGKTYPLQAFKNGIEGKVSCVVKKW